MNSSLSAASTSSSTASPEHGAHGSEHAADETPIQTDQSSESVGSNSSGSIGNNVARHWCGGSVVVDCNSQSESTEREAEDDTSNGGASKVQGGGGYSLTVDDIEEVLIELNNYERLISKDHGRPPIPSLLDSYLKFVAHVGCTHFPWTKIKWLFRAKLEQVIAEFFESFPLEEIPPTPNVDGFNFTSVKDKIFEQLEAFAGIPFTVQRIAELLTSPRRHYRRTDKFMRALEKNMLVVSTVEARSQPEAPSEETVVNGDHPAPLSASNSCGDPVGSYNQQTDTVNNSCPGVEASGNRQLSPAPLFDQLPRDDYVPSSSSSAADSVPLADSPGEKSVVQEDQASVGGGTSSSPRTEHLPPEEEVEEEKATAADHTAESSTVAPGPESDDTKPVGGVEEEELPSTLRSTNDAQPPLGNENDDSSPNVPPNSEQQEMEVENDPEPEVSKDVQEPSSATQPPDGPREEEARTEEFAAEGSACEVREKECEKSSEQGITDSKIGPPDEVDRTVSGAVPVPDDSGEPSLLPTAEKEAVTENVAMEVDSECCNNRILQCNQAPDDGSI